MGIVLATEKQPARMQLIDDQRVGFFDENTRPWPDCRDESSVICHRHQQRQIVFQPNRHVLGAKRRGDMHKTGAIFRGHIICQNHIIRLFLHGQEGVERLVAFAF